MTAAVVLGLSLAAAGRALHASDGPEAPPNAAGPSDGQQPPGPGDVPESPSPHDILVQARKKLIDAGSIQARLSQIVALGDARVTATGSYLQGKNLKLRLEYQVQAGKVSASLLEVCDGQRLWTRHTLDGQSRITLRDVRQILDATRAAAPNAHTMLATELGLGGLPALFASIDQRMTFDTLREEVIDASQPPLLAIEGTWNEQMLKRLKAASQAEDSRLPGHIPDRVRLYFDRKTLFPRRVLYLKQDGSGDELRPMVTFDLLDVVLNGPVSDDEFYFVPPDGVPQDDVTHLYIKQIQAAGGSAAPAGKP